MLLDKQLQDLRHNYGHYRNIRESHKDLSDFIASLQGNMNKYYNRNPKTEQLESRPNTENRDMKSGSKTRNQQVQNGYLTTAKMKHPYSPDNVKMIS